MADSVTTNTEQTRWTGRVKWFNNQAGYGFLTADVEGSEQDIFVHHSALVTGQDQFRYLVEGEYVSFVTVSGDDGKTTASDVTGAGGGKLMCETRWERKQANTSRRSTRDDSDSGDGVERQSRSRGNRERFRGGGPRQGDRVRVVGASEEEDGTVWELVRAGRGKGNGRSQRGGRGRQGRRSSDNDN